MTLKVRTREAHHSGRSPYTLVSYDLEQYGTVTRVSYVGEWSLSSAGLQLQGGDTASVKFLKPSTYLRLYVLRDNDQIRHSNTCRGSGTPHTEEARLGASKMFRLLLKSIGLT